LWPNRTKIGHEKSAFSTATREKAKVWVTARADRFTALSFCFSLCGGVRKGCFFSYGQSYFDWDGNWLYAVKDNEKGLNFVSFSLIFDANS